jgi:hypothetical protein
VLVADLLSHPVAVTTMLGDLLDQRRSHGPPPTRWVVPRIHIGFGTFHTTLMPHFERDGDHVRIVAATTADSDADGHLVLDLDPIPQGPEACTLITEWQLELGIPLPRTALRLAGPALDRTVASTVQRIMDRTAHAVRAAAAGDDA